MGYAGGDYGHPTYRDLGDQTECFQVDFDPRVVSYAELVDVAFASHNPTWRAHKVQYASLVLAHDDVQLGVARERAARFSAIIGDKPLATRIERLNRYWNAEDYHQKYYLRNDRALAAEFRAMFGTDEAAFRESTAAARVNGYIAGDGTNQQLTSEIGLLGLSETGRAVLASKVTGGGSGIGCGV